MTELQVIARYLISAGKEGEAYPLIEKLAEASRDEPGNISFEAYRALEGSLEVILLERYESREAFAAHRDTPHFKELVVDQIIPLLDSRGIETYDVPDQND
jgi:quinol monooxygenase YgiN